MRTQGFTLIELLIAATVALLLLGAVMTFVIGAQDVSRTTTSYAARVVQVQNLASMIGDDVRQSTVISDSLLPPSWALQPSGTGALTLTLPATTSCAVNRVTYILIPQANLPTGNVWLKSSRPSATTSAMLRVTQCNVSISTRLAAEDLTSTSFSLAALGSSTYSTAPTTATIGTPYQAVRLQIASTDERPGTLRIPRTGTLNFTSTSQSIQ